MGGLRVRRLVVRARRVAFVALLLAFAHATFPGDPEPAAPKAPDPLEGYTVARCMFREGRIALAREGQIVVLREGEPLPGTDLLLTRLTPQQAVFSRAASHPGPEARPAPAVLISKKKDGTARVEIIGQTPPPESAAPTPAPPPAARPEKRASPASPIATGSPAPAAQGGHAPAAPDSKPPADAPAQSAPGAAEKHP